MIIFGFYSDSIIMQPNHGEGASAITTLLQKKRRILPTLHMSCWRELNHARSLKYLTVLDVEVSRA